MLKLKRYIIKQYAALSIDTHCLVFGYCYNAIDLPLVRKAVLTQCEINYEVMGEELQRQKFIQRGEPMNYRNYSCVAFSSVIS